MAKDIKSEQEKTSYALGMDIGASFKKLPVRIDLEAAIEGMRDVYSNGKLKINKDEFMSLMKNFQETLQSAGEEHKRELSSENRRQQQEFLDLNRKAKGVQETASGLQYQVIEQGQGDTPAANSVVKVHYTGTLPDGSTFDSSISRGQPAQFPVNGVIPGWTEALQLMRVGSKYRLFIPANLAYGGNGAGQMIGPDQMLIFDVELLDIVG